MIHLYMATLPDRVGTLKKSLMSLAPQVDTIQVVINNFSRWELHYHLRSMYGDPHRTKSSFMGKALTVIEHDNSLQDGSRFINADKKHGYCLVCDDDILYPPDFVERMIDVYDADPDIAFLAPMGKVLKPRPLLSYYKGWAKNYKTFEHVKELTQVDIPGCCGILWHTSRAQVNHTDMNVPNSDVCIGVLARIRNLNCYVIPHAADWLKDLMPELPKGTMDIYNRYKKNDSLQTEYINKWM